MQRIIKFRGKRVDNGVWVYGSLISREEYQAYNTSPYFAIVIFDTHQDSIYNAYIEFQVDPATVGQFTGLTDKNGKEIYEGDVLSKEPFLKVTFENGGFCFSNDLLSGSDRLSQERVGRLSIIDNIHENPELCKG